LRSERRWAITGTPIQNKLTDFASIVQFLGVHPYSEQTVFEDEISRPWHRGDPQGYLRLKALVKAITIRRTKTVVFLPPRVDEIHHLTFAPDELDLYEAAKKQTIALLDDAISSRSQSNKAFNALQRLNTLRLICCHGVLARSNKVMGNVPPAHDFAESWNYSEPETSFYGQFMDSATCAQCGSNLSQFLESSTDGGLYSRQPISKQNRILCEQCKPEPESLHSIQISRQDRKRFLDGLPSPSPSRDEEDQLVAPTASMPTKIKALIADILRHHANEKRYPSCKPRPVLVCNVNAFQRCLLILDIYLGSCPRNVDGLQH
jgi:SWI/SNF-related matrix-associated actin-dependent regulator of chromatin subfamily A3